MYNEENDYELLYLIAENDDDAYNKLHNKYKQIIKFIAKKVYNNLRYCGVNLDDIYEVGLCAFYDAVDSFDEKEGNLFYTYVMSVIKKSMLTFIRNCNRYKHNILSNAISINKEIDDDGEKIENFITIFDNRVDDSEISKQRVDLKYRLPFLNALVYELKFNNFSNVEITILLNISYKKLDNIMRDIKVNFSKNVNLIEEV